MVIGALAEVFNSCPGQIGEYFENYYQLLMKFSTTENASLNRNVAYGIGVLAKKAPAEAFKAHIGTALKMTSAMFQASDADDAKDNCMITMLKMIDRFPQDVDPTQAQQIFDQVLGSLPLQGDTEENRTVLMYVFNLNAHGKIDSVGPYMDKVI